MLTGAQGAEPKRTAPGTWDTSERYGRFEGKGEVSAEFELPKGPVGIGVENLRDTDTLDLELRGPGGEEPELKRITTAQQEKQIDARYYLFRVAECEVSEPGPYRLRVKAATPDQPLLIAVGEPLTAALDRPDKVVKMGFRMLFGRRK